MHYEFYERLFTPEAVAGLCQTVGISRHPPALEQRRNPAPAEAELPESTQRTVATHFVEVYRRVAERFPEVELSTIWPSARHVL